MKITNFQEFHLSEYNYFVSGNKIIVCDKDTMKPIYDKKKDLLIIPPSKHIELFKIKINQTKSDTGILLIPARKS